MNIATMFHTTHDRIESDHLSTVQLLAVGDDIDFTMQATTVNTVVEGSGITVDTYALIEYLGPGAAN